MMRMPTKMSKPKSFLRLHQSRKKKTKISTRKIRMMTRKKREVFRTSMINLHSMRKLRRACKRVRRI